MGSKRKKRNLNHFQQTSDPPRESFGSRKRSLEQVHFVYPKKKQNGLKNGVHEKPQNFHFGKKRNERSANGHRHDASAPQSPREEPEVKQTQETLEDILYKRKQQTRKDVIEKKHGRDRQEIPSFSSDEEEETVHDTAGHLSGMSVEDAVRDKVGCRPRANSTDGELKLPQRGLCDERTVLRHFQWEISSKGKPKGFQNLGNTCFLNSTLQCLAHLPPFCQSVMALESSNHNNSNNNHMGKTSPGKKMTKMLSVLFNQMHNKSSTHHSALAPRNIVKALPTLSQSRSGHRYKFRPGRQEDAHEFLVHLLDSVNEGELNQSGIFPHKSGWRDRLPIPRLDETTFVHRVFGGYLRSQVKCTSCGFCSNTYDPFLDLSLEVSRKSCHSVAGAFAEYTRKEQLDAQNKWRCSGCKKRVRAIKQLTVFRPPLSLCVQLKRFSYSAGFAGFSGFGGGGSGKKISKPIQFPARMKLPLSDGRSCAYALTGIVIHVGGSASSGHYTACVKHNGQKWYHIDDSYTEAISEASVLKQRDAYILFYSRQEVKLEFPSPPIQSMSTKQAREFDKTRKAQNEASALHKVTESSSPSSSPDEVSRVKQLEKHKQPPAEGSVERPVAKTVTSQKHASSDTTELKAALSLGGRKRVSEEGSTSSSSSSSSSSSDTDSSTSESSNDGENANDISRAKEGLSSENPSNTKKTDTSSDESSSTTSGSDSTSESDSGANKVNGSTKRAQESSSSSSSESDSEDSSSTGESVQEKDDNTAGKKLETTADKAHDTPASSGGGGATVSPLSLLAKRRLFETTTPTTEKKKEAATKIVLDRGSNRGKVEVMMGPRKRNKKSWKPRAVVRGHGAGFELLGNLPVNRWDDDDDDDTKDVSRSKMIKEMEKKDKSRKRKMFADRWDASLDQGKVRRSGTNGPCVYCVQTLDCLLTLFSFSL